MCINCVNHKENMHTSIVFDTFKTSLLTPAICFDSSYLSRLWVTLIFTLLHNNVLSAYICMVTCFFVFFIYRKIYSRKQIYKNFLTKTIYNYIHVITSLRFDNGLTHFLAFRDNQEKLNYRAIRQEIIIIIVLLTCIGTKIKKCTKIKGQGHSQ